MKKLMILGAGVMQVPLIKVAKEMGVYTVVVGIRGDYPGLKYADKAVFVNFMDIPAVERIAREERIDGIFTCGLDMPVPTMAAISERLGLPGIPEATGRLVTDKGVMKDFFLDNGIRTAKYTIVQTEEEARKAFLSFNGPAMFKAIDGQGSRGIIKVNSLSSVGGACAYVRATTSEDHFIVEEYLDGVEFGAQAFVLNGKVQFVLPHGDYVYHANTGVPIGHYVPFEVGREVESDLREQLQKFAHAAHLGMCAINADFIFSKGRPYVLEIGARCGATMLAETVSLFYGFDYYEQMVHAALGETADFSPRSPGVANATMTLKSERSGILKGFVDNNLPNDDIIEIHFDKKPGDEIRAFRLGIDRIGHVIVKGESLAKAQTLLKEVVSKIKIEFAE